MEEYLMKSLKSNKTGNIIRVTDQQAYQMQGREWSYVSKSEWKVNTRGVEVKVEEESKKEETISEKALRHKKLKEKQREL